MASVPRPSMRWPSNSMRPRVFTIALLMARSTVVLPAPLAPSSAVIPPSGTSMFTAFRTAVVR
jgi:hypothetical protein